MRWLRPFALALPLALALGSGPVRADLNRLETVAVRFSGHVLDHGYIRTVFYAPLGLLWILRPESAQAADRFSEMLLSLWLERVTSGLRVTAIGIGDRYPRGLVWPVVHCEGLVRRLLLDYRSMSADRHDLARFHDRLLERPLARDLVLHRGRMDSLGIPAGSRLRVFSNVSQRHGNVDMPDDGRSPMVWKSYGNWIRFFPANGGFFPDDGGWTDLPWTEVDRYLARPTPAVG